MSWSHLLELIWLMMPAYAANMAPPFVRFWKGWNPPLSARLLGTHKTTLGFGLGVAAGVLTAWALSATVGLSPLAGDTHWAMLGVAQGAGALTGDALKSLLKRRAGVPPGARWIPADQLDFPIGALALSAPWVRLNLSDVLVVLVFTFAADLLVNRIAWRIGVRSTPW